MENNYNNIMAMVLNDLGFESSPEQIERFINDDSLTVNTCRNGHIVVWYMDEANNSCYDVTDSKYMTEEEIEDQLC